MSSGLAAAALVGGRDVQVFAVFGDGAAGDLNSLPLQEGGQLIVGEGMPRVFFVDELANFTLEDDQRGVGAFRSAGAMA